MAYADYIHCVECDCKVVYYTGDDNIKVLCEKCYQKNLDMIADFLYAWDWWKEDEYDIIPNDTVYDIKEYMKKLGKYGVTKVKNEKS